MKRFNQLLVCNANRPRLMVTVCGSITTEDGFRDKVVLQTTGNGRDSG